MNSFGVNSPVLSAFGRNWGWFMLWGFALSVLGLLAIYFSAFTSLFSVILLGVLLFISGAVVLVDTFTFWMKKGSGFALHLLMGILYVVAGVMLLTNPIFSLVSLTFILAVLYMLVGIFRLIYSLTLRAPRWGWSFFNGLLAILIGILILNQWPASGLFIIGLFVGIDLLFTGWAYIMAAMAGKALVK